MFCFYFDIFYKNLCQFHTVVFTLISLQIITFIPQCSSCVLTTNVSCHFNVLGSFICCFQGNNNVNGKRDLKNLPLFYIYRNCSPKLHQCLIIVRKFDKLIKGVFEIQVENDIDQMIFMIFFYLLEKKPFGGTLQGNVYKIESS